MRSIHAVQTVKNDVIFTERDCYNEHRATGIYRHTFPPILQKLSLDSKGNKRQAFKVSGREIAAKHGIKYRKRHQLRLGGRREDNVEGSYKI